MCFCLVIKIKSYFLLLKVNSEFWQLAIFWITGSICVLQYVQQSRWPWGKIYYSYKKMDKNNCPRFYLKTEVQVSVFLNKIRWFFSTVSLRKLNMTFMRAFTIWTSCGQPKLFLSLANIFYRAMWQARLASPVHRHHHQEKNIQCETKPNLGRLTSYQLPHVHLAKIMIIRNY